MKFNYQQMKDTFGIIYSYDSYGDRAYIHEGFDTQLTKFYKCEPTFDEAHAKVLIDIKDEKKAFFERMEEKKASFKNLPFLEKLNWQIKNRQLNFDAIAEQRKLDYANKIEKKLNNISFEEIDKDKQYIINSPSILQAGERLYVVVTDHNALEIGVYEAVVTKANYFTRREGLIDLDASLSITENGETQQFSLESDENKFTSRHAYHNIFTDKEKAIEFHNESIKNKLEKMEQRIIRMDSKDSLKKPKLK